MAVCKIDETSFPLYDIQALNSNLVVCAGGGGSAKTGVKNAINIYKLIADGSSFKSECLCEVDTGPRAVMNLHVNHSRDVLAVGVDHLCQFYQIKYQKENDKDQLTLTSMENIATVPAPSTADADDGEYQKCVRFTPDGNHFVTGGSDGSCKIFKYPSLELVFTIKKAHSDEIDEIDVHPNSKYFVSVSKSTSAGLWRITDGLKETELSFALSKKDDDFYRFRNCRFSESKDSKEKSIYLYTTHIPRKYSKEKVVNCLVKWCTRKWIPESTAFIKKNTLSSLATSVNGRYIGVGTAEGSVLLYISWNMAHLKTISAVHDIFVTGMSFIPENKLLCEDMKQDAAVLTCSIDNKCQVTLIPSRHEYSLTVFLVVLVLFIGVVFNAITYLDFDF